MPSFKPAFSPERLRAHNYIDRLVVTRRTVADAAGGFRDGYDGAHDYDFVLRLTEQARRVAHVPRILCHTQRPPVGAAADGDGDRGGGRRCSRRRRSLRPGRHRRRRRADPQRGLLSRRPPARRPPARQRHHPDTRVVRPGVGGDPLLRVRGRAQPRRALDVPRVGVRRSCTTPRPRRPCSTASPRCRTSRRRSCRTTRRSTSRRRSTSVSSMRPGACSCCSTTTPS